MLYELKIEFVVSQFEVRPYKPYSFSYKVKDPKTYNDFGHEEHSNGHSIHGSYHVALPDGRTQRVTYTADHNGYFPVIKYEGEARHPDPPKPAYPPAYSSPYSGYSSPYSGYPSATSSSSYSPPAYPSYSPAKSSYPSADTASYASTSSAYRGPANSLTSYGSSYPEEPPTYYPQSVSTAGSYKRDPPVSHSSGVNELPSYVISSSASPVSTPAPQTSAPSAASPAYRGLHYNAMPVYVIQSQVYQTPRYGTLQPHSTYNDDNNQLASSYYYPTTTSQTSEIPTLYYPLTAPAAQVHYPNCPLAKHYHVPY